MRAIDLMASLVLEDGERWGDVAEEFQWSDARAVLGAEAPPYHFLTRSRGASKTGDLAGMAIAAMLTDLAPGSRLYCLAADRDQGALFIDSIASYASRTPELSGALDIGAFRVTATASGSTLEILAADAPSAWGLRPAFVVVDELAHWSDTSGARRLWDAVATATAKREGSRLVVLTTAGDPAHFSRRILDHAYQDELWRVHEVPGPAPWMSESRLAEQRRRLPDSTYRRLFMNEWTEGEDSLALEDDFAACVTLDGPQEPRHGTRYVIGVDLGLKKDRTVCAVAHAERAEPTWTEGRQQDPGRRVVLDRMEVWSGSRIRPVKLADVEDWLLQAVKSFSGATVVIDPWQAVGLSQRLRAKGVKVEEFTFSSQSVGRLASTLHLLIRDHLLALPDDPELLDELAAVRLVETSPGVYRIDHQPGRHDDRAVAIALAAQHLLSRSDRRTRQGVWGVSTSRTGGRGERYVEFPDDSEPVEPTWEANRKAAQWLRQRTREQWERNRRVRR